METVAGRWLLLLVLLTAKLKFFFYFSFKEKFTNQIKKNGELRFFKNFIKFSFFFWIELIFNTFYRSRSSLSFKLSICIERVLVVGVRISYRHTYIDTTRRMKWRKNKLLMLRSALINNKDVNDDDNNLCIVLVTFALRGLYTHTHTSTLFTMSVCLAICMFVCSTSALR